MEYRWRIEIYNKAELSDQNHSTLVNLCKKNNVKFLTSIFNINDLEFISTLSTEAIKIPSHEVYNLELTMHHVKNLKKFLFRLVLVSGKSLKKF